MSIKIGEFISQSDQFEQIVCRQIHTHTTQIIHFKKWENVHWLCSLSLAVICPKWCPHYDVSYDCLSTVIQYIGFGYINAFCFYNGKSSLEKEHSGKNWAAELFVNDPYLNGPIHYSELTVAHAQIVYFVYRWDKAYAVKLNKVSTFFSDSSVISIGKKCWIWLMPKRLTWNHHYLTTNLIKWRFISLIKCNISSLRKK